MAIPDEKIAEWKRVVHDAEAYETDEDDVPMTREERSLYRSASEAIPALLAEREEMLALLREAMAADRCFACGLSLIQHEDDEHATGCRLVALFKGR